MKATFALILLMLMAAACTAAPSCKATLDIAESTVDPFDACDPIQPINEAVFQFNVAIDAMLIRPVAEGYHLIPETGRAAIDNFLTNLKEPGNALNSTLQGDLQSAGTSLWRFLLNSTFGFAGLRDFAGENGLKYNEQTFEKTLASYGSAEGAYVVLPVIGPSSARGSMGKVVDWFTDPVGWYLTTSQSIAQTVADGIDTRDQDDAIIDQFYYQSLEPYTATRSAYLQHQAFQ